MTDFYVSTLRATDLMKERDRIAPEGAYVAPYPSIVDDDQETAYAAILQEVKAIEKDLEFLQAEVLEPIKEAEKLVRKLINERLAPLKQAEADLKRALTQHAAQRNAALKAAEAAAKAAAATTHPSPAVGIMAGAATLTAPHRTPDGLSFRTTWKAEVTDLFELLRGIVSGAVPSTFVKPDQVALNSWARATKGVSKMPGVKVTQDTAAVSR